MGMTSALRAVAAALLLGPAMGDVGQVNGLPANPYDPYCAMACLRSFSSLTLSCSEMSGETVGMMEMVTPSSCWAINEPYLESLAYCMHEKCAEDDIKNSKLEHFWETETTGQSQAGQAGVAPKWSYSDALAQVNSVPRHQVATDDTWLNVTSLVNPSIYTAQWNILVSVQQETARENVFG